MSQESRGEAGSQELTSIDSAPLLKEPNQAEGFSNLQESRMPVGQAGDLGITKGSKISQESSSEAGSQELTAIDSAVLLREPEQAEGISIQQDLPGGQADQQVEDISDDLAALETILDKLKECSTVREAYDILEHVKKGCKKVIVLVPREEAEAVVAEFKERLRNGSPSSIQLRSEIDERLKEFLKKIIPEEADGILESGAADSQQIAGREKLEKEIRNLAKKFNTTIEIESSDLVTRKEHFSRSVRAVSFAGADSQEIHEAEFVPVTVVTCLEVSETKDNDQSLVDSLFNILKSPIRWVTAVVGRTLWSETKDDKPKDDNCGPDVSKTTKICAEYIAYNWYIFGKEEEFLLISLHCLFPDMVRMKEVLCSYLKDTPVQHRHMCSFLMRLGLNCICGLELHNECKREPIGKLARAVYKEGIFKNSQHVSGVEIALLRMEKDRLKVFNLPTRIFHQWKSFGLPDTLNFHGECIQFQHLSVGQEVYKIGNATGLTKGLINNKMYPCIHKNLKLYNQLEVSWGKERFSGKGDSGSAVFAIDDETKTIKAVGILTGSSPKAFSVVTPVSEIFHWLGFECKLRPFAYRVVENKLQYSCV